MKPTKNSLWKYIGPFVAGCPARQVQKVIYSSDKEVITIGIPLGHGGTWIGLPANFAQEFEYLGEGGTAT